MRLDQKLVALGLAASRSRAQALLKAGVVRVNGAIATKASDQIADNATVMLDDNPIPWVSRAALKLVHALDFFKLSPNGCVALDCGASTGGFTEVLLTRGAKKVYAIDVGREQLAEPLASDPRVEERSGLNLKALTREHAPEPIDFITADLSFIALSKALPAALSLAETSATLVVLVKPQFEVGRAAIGKGGLVKDPDAQAQAVDGVKAFLEASDWAVIGVTDSPILGGDGNREFLLAARKS